MGKFDGKRVLQLGHSALSRYALDYIRANGAYIIAADKCPEEKNAYRRLVNETVQLDIDHTARVIEYCRANKIDAVFGGGPEEASYEKARIINEGIGNAYCHTEKQWQSFAKKDNFRKLCMDCGLDVPKTYYMGTAAGMTEEAKAEISFPAIVKPVDNTGGDGISVVFDRKELDGAISCAAENSASSKIIAEEYIEGRECAFTYVVQDGTYRLTASADKYVYKNEKNLTATPELYIYPCADHDRYADTVNETVLSMLKGQGLNNCTVFFQAIEKDGKFYIFEAGLRFEGTKNCILTERFTGQNALHFYCDYILKTKTEYDITKEDPKLNGHAIAMFLIHLKRGRIRQIRGKKKIFDNDRVFRITYLKQKGDLIGENQIEQCFAAFCMEGSDKEDLARQIRFIKKTLKVRGCFYRNMIVDSFDERVLIKNK